LPAIRIIRAVPADPPNSGLRENICMQGSTIGWASRCAVGRGALIFVTCRMVPTQYHARTRPKCRRRAAAAQPNRCTVRFRDSVVSQNSVVTPHLYERKELRHATKEQKNGESGRSLPGSRPTPHTTQDTPDHIGRKQSHLRRLPAAARLCPRDWRSPWDALKTEEAFGKVAAEH
jgi:hypothetical protein